MVNCVLLIGRLGKNPEIQYSRSGTPYAHFTIAVNEYGVDRSGERITRTNWIRVTCFNKIAENCSRYLVKGSLIHVFGSLQVRSWKDQQGQTRYITEVVARKITFLEKRGSQSQQYQQQQQQGYPGDYGEYNEFQDAPPQQQTNNGNNTNYQNGNFQDPGYGYPNTGTDDVPF